MTWASFPRIAMRLRQSAEERTECPPTAISSPCPTTATSARPALLRVKCPTASSPRATPTRRWPSSRSKRKGGYNVIEIDPNYVPAAVEHKDVFGVTFEQGRNNLKISTRPVRTTSLLRIRTLPQGAKIDLLLALITLKYTQSNSVCYVKDGQAIGIGAGQQSRIHCTRLAGNKADIWYLRQHREGAQPAVHGKDIRRADRDNTIDVYISDDYMDVLADGEWEKYFTTKPDPLTRRGKARLAGYPERRIAGFGRLLPVRRQH